MWDYATGDSQTPEIQARASRCLEDGAGCPIVGVFDHVRKSLSFVGDEITGEPLASMYGDGNGERPEVVEVLIRPVDQELFVQDGMGQGDCDDYSMYAASLLTALGVPCSFVTVAANPGYPDEFSHVYVAAYPKSGGRVALDCSHGPHPGWEYDRPLRIQEWPVSGVSGNPFLFLAAIAGVAWLCRKDLFSLWRNAA